MKVYNPIKGKYIEKYKWNTDEFREIESLEVKEVLLNKYPFLIDFDLPKYQPDYYKDTIPSGFHKFIWRIKAKLRDLWRTGIINQ